MNFHYYINENYTISDTEYCKKSKRTFDINLFDLANNGKLLDLLKLYYIGNHYISRFNYESRAIWFCGYLESFKRENIEEFYNKCLTNPVVRLLITDDDLLERVKSL